MEIQINGKEGNFTGVRNEIVSEDFFDSTELCNDVALPNTNLYSTEQINLEILAAAAIFLSLIEEANRNIDQEGSDNCIEIAHKEVENEIIIISSGSESGYSDVGDSKEASEGSGYDQTQLLGLVEVKQNSKLLAVGKISSQEDLTSELKFQMVMVSQKSVVNRFGGVYSRKRKQALKQVGDFDELISRNPKKVLKGFQM